VSRAWAAIGAGALLTGVALWALVVPWRWEARQAAASRRLVSGFAARAAVAQGPGACSASGPASGSPGGLLGFPGGVVVPVLQGASQAVLAEAAGHLPGTPWPGGRGTAVVLGHDVGDFSVLAGLGPGAVLRWWSGCDEATFVVLRRVVARPGERLGAVGSRGLALVTCWPSDALWWTPERLVLLAVLTGERRALPPSRPRLPGVPAAGLPGVSEAAQVLLQQWPMGTFQVDGDPSKQWLASNRPLALELAALGVLERWRESGTLPGALAGCGGVPSSPLGVVEEVQGTAPTAVTLQGTTSAGDCRLTLQATGSQLTPAG
jgi:sortase A